MSALTQQDVNLLLRQNAPEVLAVEADKIAGLYNEGEMSSAEVALAEDIFRILLDKAEAGVRRILSEKLKDNPRLPREVALKMAWDVADVALPMLQWSLVLLDEDLIEIIREQPPEYRRAIARRASLSAAVADTIVASEDEDAVAVLVANPGATIREATLHEIISSFPGSEKIKTGLVYRPSLPLTVAERLVTVVSGHLLEYLVGHHDLSPDVAADAIMRTHEDATLELISDDTPSPEIERLARQMHASGRLTPRLVLRAVCKGDLAFFEAAMACLADLSVASVRTLIRDGGARGLPALFFRADLPHEMFEPIQIAAGVARQFNYAVDPMARSHFRQRMTDRFLARYAEFGTGDLEYLLDRLCPPPGSSGYSVN